MKTSFICTLSFLLGFCLLSNAHATGNVGNVTVQGTGTCTIPKNISPIFVTEFQQTVNGVVNTVYKIAILNNIKTFSQPQYIVDTLNQVGNATSGTASVFNNGFLGGVTDGTWSGTISFDAFLDFVITNLTITTGTSPNTCVLTFTNGLAIFTF